MDGFFKGLLLDFKDDEMLFEDKIILVIDELEG